MEITRYNIAGLFSFQSRLFEDDRGYFFESYNKAFFDLHVPGIEFFQDNQSLSKKDVIRGLHFQNPPFEQGKLIRVIQGSALDVVVDIRKNSPTYGQHLKLLLSGENRLNFWIPSGFAHGFLSLEDDTLFSYKVSGPYNANSEDSLLWNDVSLKIDWGINQPIISDKDQRAKSFSDFNSPF